MQWKFSELRPEDVASDVTQRDQFHNDELDLSASLVREVVQNSLDAKKDGNEGPVRVAFRFCSCGDGAEAEAIRQMVDEQLPHAGMCGRAVTREELSSPSALVIEEFNTKGLVGSTEERNDDNFSVFWRNHGRGNKTGRARGRWGLGKLVLSLSSKIGVFFGMTVREGDDGPLLMGQTVLQLRKSQGKWYLPHGFYADIAGEDHPVPGLPIPSKDPSVTVNFHEIFGLERGHATGVSFVSLFPEEEITADDLIVASILHYFYPILTGDLVVTVGEMTLDSTTIKETLQRHEERLPAHLALLVDFVEKTKSAPAAFAETQLLSRKTGPLSEQSFSEEDLAKLKRAFSEGELNHVVVPVEVRPKGEAPVTSRISLYLQRKDDLSKGRDLYVREGLDLSQEKHLNHRRALGLFVPDEEGSEFLARAENPAHTRWNGRAEKLAAKYSYPPETLRLIRTTLVNLYDALAETSKDRDEEALMDILSVSKPSDRKPDPQSPKRTKERPEPPIKPKQTPPWRIAQLSSGFAARPTKQARDEEYPLEGELIVAYDVVRGNPFKKYDKLDFTLDNQEIVCKEVEILEARGNLLRFRVTHPEFEIKVEGFDPNRDLMVKIAKSKDEVA